ncbi:MAG: hypothetical protein ABIK77_08240 [candidate division WOR-3 bacterium]|uniref:Uncharacterized protein n=1 Tax=candidate division WOR-3 bacterium TaxID=2052148 RepID=A0A7C4W9A4_UNCW3
MKKIILFLFLINIIFSKAKWVAYKETLFIGEPIITIFCYKNDTPFLQQILDWPSDYFDFYIICEGKKYKIPRLVIEGWVKRETITIFPGDSFYIINPPFFYRDFRLLEKTGFSYFEYLPFKYGKFTIYTPIKIWTPLVIKEKQGFRDSIIRYMDSIILYFKEPTDEKKKEFFDFIKYYESGGDWRKLEKLIEKYKDTILLPYINWVSVIKTDVEDKKNPWRWVYEREKMLNKMRKKFPNHILTEYHEFNICGNYFMCDPKKGYKLYKKLKKKYPYNYEVKMITKQFEAKIKKLEGK